MYIISLTYKVPLDIIDQHLTNHVSFLNKHYELGNFLLSGKKAPRTGGVILAQAKSEEGLMEIISEDPFHQHDLADYEFTAFVPTKSSPQLNFLMD